VRPGLDGSVGRAVGRADHNFCWLWRQEHMASEQVYALLKYSSYPLLCFHLHYASTGTNGRLPIGVPPHYMPGL
jgi:hypothetical protein